MKGYILFGPMGAGKTTAAGMLAELFGEDGIEPIVISLSEGIRIIGKMIIGKALTRAQKQTFGQAARTIFGADVWNEWLYRNELDSIEAGEPFYDRAFIIDDGRQMNEYDFWTAKGLIPVGINAPVDIRCERVKIRDGEDPTPYMRHETERRSLEVINRIVCANHGYFYENIGGVDDLHFFAEKVYKETSWE